MKSLFLSFSLICATAIPGIVHADGPTRHIVSGVTSTNGPVESTQMDERLQEAAQEYAADAPVPRIGFYDSALPIDADEYKALDGFGVLMVTLVSQDKEELPPRRVYATIGGKQVELHLFKSMSTSNERAPDVQQVLGKYRWDGLYYFPTYLLMQAQELLLDFAKNRDGFVLTRFSRDETQLPEALRSVSITPPHGAAPALPAFMQMVRREYPGLLEKMDGANRVSPPIAPGSQ